MMVAKNAGKIVLVNMFSLAIRCSASEIEPHSLYKVSQIDLDCEEKPGLPKDFPCMWRHGRIPFAFNFYSPGPKRLIGLVTKAHELLMSQSCLQFIEHNPVLASRTENFTYLSYSFSGVHENCCLKYYKKPVGKRVLLITPVCSTPAEVAHVTLHGLGLTHKREAPFNKKRVHQLLFFNECSGSGKKMDVFDINKEIIPKTKSMLREGKISYSSQNE